MKALKTFIISLLYFPLTSSAQNKPDTNKINFIRTQFTSINRHILSYKKITRNDMNQSTEGGKVTAYFDGKELKKITGSYYGETFRLTEECYFYKNKPIFFYTIRNHYKVPINVDSHALVDSTFEDRYYFNGDNIIKYSCSPQRRLSSIMLNNAVKEASREAMRLTKLLNGNVR